MRARLLFALTIALLSRPAIGQQPDALELWPDGDGEPEPEDDFGQEDALDDDPYGFGADDPAPLVSEPPPSSEREAPAVEHPAPSHTTVPREARFFRDLSYTLPQEPFTAVASDPGDPEIIMAGSDGFLFKSDDAGESWRVVLSFPRGLPQEVLLQGELGVSASSVAAAPDVQLPAGEGIDLGVDFSSETNPDLTEDDAEDVAAQAAEDAQFDQDLPDGDFDLIEYDRILPRRGMGVRRVRYVAASSKTVYVATPRGLFRSLDSGENFSRIDLPSRPLGNDIRDIAIDEAWPSHLYVGTGAGLLISRDGGASFERAPDQLGAIAILSIDLARVDDKAHLLVGTEMGLYRSRDGGDTFQTLLLQGLPPLAPVHTVAFDPRENVTYAGTTRGLYVGERNTNILEARPAFGRQPIFSLLVDTLRAGGIAVGVMGRGVYFSDDTGFSLLSLGDQVAAENVRDITRVAGDPDRLLLATDRGVFVHDRGTGISVATDKLRQLQDRWRREPTLAESARAALHFAGLSPARLHATTRRAREAYLAPQLRFLYRYSLGRRRNADRLVILVDEPQDFDDEDPKDYRDLRDTFGADFAPMRGQLHEVFVQARWDLDRVMFNPDEPKVQRLAPRRMSEETRIINRVRTLYSARRRLQNQIALADASESAPARARKLLRLAELTALLDASTGGAFMRSAHLRGAELGDLTAVDPMFTSSRPALGPAVSHPKTAHRRARAGRGSNAGSAPPR